MGANAQTTVPTFTAGQVLTADQLNNSARTGVPVFADTTARDAGFGGSGEKVLAEGQLAYIEASDVVQYYNGSAWATVGPSSAGAVAQVKSTTKTDTFTTTSSSFTDITGLSVSITPTSASNKILVVFAANVGTDPASTAAGIRLLRDSTAIAIGDTAGSRYRTTSATIINNANQMATVAMTFLDSPATTSATTYKLQAVAVSGTTIGINRGVNDGDSSAIPRAVSSITVFEVSP